MEGFEEGYKTLKANGKVIMVGELHFQNTFPEYRIHFQHFQNTVVDKTKWCILYSCGNLENTLEKTLENTMKLLYYEGFFSASYCPRNPPPMCVIDESDKT